MLHLLQERLLYQQVPQQRAQKLVLVSATSVIVIEASKKAKVQDSSFSKFYASTIQPNLVSSLLRCLLTQVTGSI